MTIGPALQLLCNHCFLHWSIVLVDESLFVQQVDKATKAAVVGVHFLRLSSVDRPLRHLLYNQQESDIDKAVVKSCCFKFCHNQLFVGSRKIKAKVL